MVELFKKGKRHYIIINGAITEISRERYVDLSKLPKSWWKE